MKRVSLRKNARWLSVILFVIHATLTTGFTSLFHIGKKESKETHKELAFNHSECYARKDSFLLQANYNTTASAKTKKIIRILAIGNSFSQDAVEQYLYELAESEGISVNIGNMFLGGCSLKTHLLNAKNNIPAYEYRKIENGVKVNRKNVTLSEGITDEKWDYISLQQVSGNSGQFETYETTLPDLVQYVKRLATNHKMKLILHQPWAYSQNSTHNAFSNYDNDQMKMYRSIVDAVNRAAKLKDIKIIIPSGTAIQNGRTSYIGDNFNRDGYHLELTYGRYTVACVWFEKIFGKNVIGNSFAPNGADPYKIKIAQHAAHEAVLNPNEVTVLREFRNSLEPPEDRTTEELILYE